MAIAGLLVSFRPVWLLDEPTAGLDRGSERRFSALRRAHLGEGGIMADDAQLPSPVLVAASEVLLEGQFPVANDEQTVQAAIIPGIHRPGKAVADLR